jgi:hypothetical protein
MPPKKNDTTISISKDTKKVNNKQTKLSKESESKELESKESKEKESEEESKEEESEEEESEEEESENEESENEESESEESESEEEDNSKKSVKDKKVKKTWQDNIDELTQLIADFKKNENEHKLIQENLHKNEKAHNELVKQLSRIVLLLGKSHDEELKRVLKAKPKRKGNNSSGFNKETPVPPKLIKYLSLDNDIQMSRPKVVSLLYQKFKSENLTSGQNITLDKTTAKIFGKEKDYEFNFKQIQTFIKEIYDEAFPKS